MVGYKGVPGGLVDPDCTHVILTKKEYEAQIQKISAAGQMARDTKYSAEREIQRIWNDAKNKMAEQEMMVAQRLEDMNQELEEQKQKTEYQRSLNQNLLRIAKERANTDRKLRPKKEHTGYVVAYSAEREYRYKKDRLQWGRAVLWETVIQSPYTVEFDEEQAKGQIWEDLFRIQEDGAWLIKRIGIELAYQGKYENLLALEEWETEYQANILLEPETKFRANFKTSYWEVVVLHTKALGVVPPDMRARSQ